ncbi:MAG: head-tail connector protein [Ruminococcus sp.]|nr:head-tail connector protein [Ruminococcus sp.]MDE7104670.1 head-tail connector protein [Ruminococcus sp.]
MKVNELTIDIIKDYCGICDNDSDEIIEKVLLPFAKSYVKGYTGLSDNEINQYDDISIACMVLINDAYTQRDYTLSLHKQVNPCVKTILGMYAKNYL